MVTLRISDFDSHGTVKKLQKRPEEVINLDAKIIFLEKKIFT